MHQSAIPVGVSNVATVQGVVPDATAICGKLENIQKTLDQLLGHQAKAYYTVEEFAEKVGRAAYSIRQACNLGRIRGEKASHCGKHQRWSISHKELERYQKEGLLPIRKP